MNLTYCNVTAEDGDVTSEEPLVGSLTFHQFGLIVAAACSIIAVALSMFLMLMHATHYTEPLEQRYILRILFMVPVYAVVSFLSFMFYSKSVYFEVLRDCYEAFAIASFFSLMCHYVAPDLHEQKNFFRTITPKPWIWPLKWCGWSMFRTPRSGLTWFNVIWFCIFQYCAVRVACTILAVVTNYFGRYCYSSDSPLFAHVWVTVIEAIAVTIAMICLIQFYIQLKEKLSPYNPFWKLLAIKLVIFLCFWQSFGLSILTSQTLDVINPGKHVAQPDLSVGIPAFCICCEMAMFAIMHVFVYPWRPYVMNAPISMQLENQTGAKRDTYHGGPLGVKAFLDAFNPIDIFKAVGRGFRWMFVGRKKREQDPSYRKDSAAEGILGEGTTLGPLSTLGKNSKYQKLDDGDEENPFRSREDLADQSGTNRPAEYSMSSFSRPAPNPYEIAPPRRPNPDMERPPSPYEAYRAQRQSQSGRHQPQKSYGGDLGSMPHAPQDNPFEPVPTAPTPTPMHPSHGQVPYPMNSTEQAMMGLDTSYHRSEQHENPWGPNRL